MHDSKEPPQLLAEVFIFYFELGWFTFFPIGSLLICCVVSLYNCGCEV